MENEVIEIILLNFIFKFYSKKMIQILTFKIKKNLFIMILC